MIEIEKEKLKKYSTLSITSGIILAIAAFLVIIHLIVTIIHPILENSALAVFGTLFIAVGLVQCYITFKVYQKSAGAWIKVLLPLITGILLLIWPESMIMTTGYLFAAYFFINGYASYRISFDLRPPEGRQMAIRNSVLNFILCIIYTVIWLFNPILTAGVCGVVGYLIIGRDWGLAVIWSISIFLLGMIIMILMPPVGPHFLIAITVGVSFLMDGIVLIYLGRLAKKWHYD